MLHPVKKDRKQKGISEYLLLSIAFYSKMSYLKSLFQQKQELDIFYLSNMKLPLHQRKITLTQKHPCAPASEGQNSIGWGYVHDYSKYKCLISSDVQARTHSLSRRTGVFDRTSFATKCKHFVYFFVFGGFFLLLG